MINNEATKLYEIFKDEKVETLVNIDRSKVIDFYKDLRMALFLNYYFEKPTIDHINRLLTNSRLDLQEALQHLNIDIEPIINEFYTHIDTLREKLKKDIVAIYNGDPACNSLSEVVLTYPGFIAISAYRIANILYNLNLKSVARVISEYAHSRTGIDINPGATIGENFFIDHGTGIVIGETCVIGNNVKIYQGVTLGALSLKEGHSLQGKKRHPTIEDNVTIYSSSSIFGGNTIIGKGSTIGSNCYLTCSIPENSIVRNKPCDIEVLQKSKADPK
jgi:serine O-acetyltransferase